LGQLQIAPSFSFLDASGWNCNRVTVENKNTSTFIDDAPWRQRKDKTTWFQKAKKCAAYSHR
jgi:hypothetical protein